MNESDSGSASDTDPSTDDAPRVLADQVHAGFQPTGLAAGPDGAPLLPGASSLVVLNDVDWICLRGPCRNYHRLEMAVDAQMPMDGTRAHADGTPAGGTGIVHTCYPAPGREMDMTDTLVRECNRWDPIDPRSPEARGREARRRRFLEEDAALVDELAADEDTEPTLLSIRPRWLLVLALFTGIATAAALAYNLFVGF